MSQSPVGALILGGRRCYEYKISLKYKGVKNKTKKNWNKTGEKKSFYLPWNMSYFREWKNLNMYL